MRLLFATDRMHVPHDRSGSVQSTHALISAIVQQGVACEILASLPRNARHFLATAVFKSTGGKIVLSWKDVTNGYVTRRGSQWRFAERVERGIENFRPDALVLDSIRQLRILHSRGWRPSLPVLVVVCDLLFLNGPAFLPYAGSIRLIANSPLTADMLRAHFRHEVDVVPPLVQFQQYKTDRSDAQYVTFVSPHTRKGLHLALEAAKRLPDVQFLFVEGWPMAEHQWRGLERQVAELRNITLERSHADMRNVYRRTRLLIVPSMVQETFGRVVVEAQASGIPVLVRDAGALAFTVGEGGVVLSESASAADWSREIYRVLTDPQRHTELSRMAVQNVEREDFAPERIVSSFLEIARGVAGHPASLHDAEAGVSAS